MVEIEIFETANGVRALVLGRSLREIAPVPTKYRKTAHGMQQGKPNENETALKAMERLRVSVLSPADKATFISFPEESTVVEVIGEIEGSEEMTFRVRFEDGHIEAVSFDRLIKLENGRDALESFENGPQVESEDQRSDSASQSEPEDVAVVKTSPLKPQPKAPRGQRRLMIEKPILISDSDSEDVLSKEPAKLPRRPSRRQLELEAPRRSSRHLKGQTKRHSTPDESSSSKRSSSESSSNRKGRGARFTRSRQLRRKPKRAEPISEDEDNDSSSEDVELLQSDILPKKRKTKRAPPVDKARVKPSKRARVEPTRQSNRSTRNQANMEEVAGNDVYRSDSDTARRPPKPVGVRETFQSLPSNDRFVRRHCQQCETCGKWGGGPYGELVHCQGCTLSYHKLCLGTRSTRDHLVTKVGDENFVLQCRRCVSFARRKEATAPMQGMCQSCRKVGRACKPFRERKSPAQEERERNDNDGEDPIVHVDPFLINNANNVLFRCMTCWRAFHIEHLHSKAGGMIIEEDEARLSDELFKEYAKDWTCIECDNKPAKVSGLVAWRPVDQEAYQPGAVVQDVDEDQKEYLVKWEAKSYFRCLWMPGAWVWGVTGASSRKAFARRNNGSNLPIMNTEDAIPEEYLRIDIVLDVSFTSIVHTRAEEVDKARIREVSQAFIKYKGLTYEEAVWETVPEPDDAERWTDFVTAYDDWVMRRYVRCPKLPALMTRLEKARSLDFSTALAKKKQPEKLVGGELMKYQLDGLNWLYFRWYQQKNAILADEMGLGKTMQIIAFLVTLVQDHNCFPFLIVVPNSTCPNWRREIKKWAPTLGVVTYFGSAEARRLAYQYELFPEASKDLRCHVVITSYEAAIDDASRRFFKSVQWQCLIVDEGQRLKNDVTQLYGALTALNIPFRILLTGTPLQNNARELFNLMQFIDQSFDAAQLEIDYETLTKENVPQLHELIRPYFLRRTKAQVLTFLPPMAQVIIPVSMSSVQTKLYKSILEKNSDLVRAIFNSDSRGVGKSERANLNNILMQLRKCLCHPFVFSREIEEQHVEATISHRNLVEASAKLQLLEILLPKLHERGHRVLIFSQFLDMLDIIEDFLDGLTMRYQRLDGSVSSLEKQKRIDEFNAPESPLFAFLLSTRAGGVGINLATADTVIILDPDFNPHQDIQALSRAHRIGQKNKVLVFQLMTRASVEEKIVQVGRKKMALDHIVIERMDNDEDEGVDMESILRFGAADILQDKTDETLRYDDSSVEKLLDRSQIEDTSAGDDKTAESQFSFARVWANDAASMMDSLGSDSNEEDKAPDPSVWDRILKERERLAAEEAAARQQMLGRGRRARQRVDYTTTERTVESPVRGRRERNSDSDTDFRADRNSTAEGDETEEDGERDDEAISAEELKEVNRSQEPQTAHFRRSTILWPTTGSQIQITEQTEELDRNNPFHNCPICSTRHRIGYCPLKLAGPELCNLCGLAHYGVARFCPHIASETQVREMLEALKQSPESKELINIARKYLQGVKGSLVQEKKKKRERLAHRNEVEMQNTAPSHFTTTLSVQQGAQVTPTTKAPHTTESNGTVYQPMGFAAPLTFPPATYYSSQH